jgi:hypothetical protein
MHNTIKEKPFEARMKLLNDKFPAENDSYVVVVKQILCKGKDHLQEQVV